MTRIISIIILFTTYACVNNGVVRKYYDTGELKKIETLVCPKDSLVKIEEYYRNGQLKEEGFIVRGRYPHGVWKEYYKDGSIKWEGEYGSYFKNYDEDSIINAIEHVKIEFEDRDNPYFKIGEQIRFRIKFREIHPRLYALYVMDEAHHIRQQIETDHKNQYPYLLDIDSLFVWEWPESDERGVYALIVFANRDGLIDIENSQSAVIQIAIIE